MTAATTTNQLLSTHPATEVASHPFWDGIADRYARKPVPDESVYQRKLEITRRHLRPEMTVFEFGCGTGSTAIAHAPFVRHLQAIDVSARMLEIAGSRAATAGVGNVTFELADIDEFSAPEESFDVVLGLSILHLVEDREAVIAKVRRLLKPGGLFVTSTACLGDKLWFFKYIEPIGRRLGLMPMVRVFTAGELLESLTAAGFKIDHRWQPEKSHTAFIVARKS